MFRSCSDSSEVIFLKILAIPRRFSIRGEFIVTFLFPLMLFVSAIECKQNFAQETSSKQTIETGQGKLSHEFLAKEKSPSLWLSEGSLGSLSCKETYELDFVLTNKTSRTIDVSRPKPNCSCGAVELESSSIAIDRAVKGRIRFTCPENSSVNSSDLAIDFHNADGVPSGRVLIKYELRNNLFVDSPGLLKMSNSKVNEFKLPIVFSDPILPKNIEISGHESLTELELFSKVEADANGHVYLLLSASATKKATNSFTVVPIVLKDPKEKVEFPLNLTFQAYSDLEIAPLNLTFRASELKSGALEGNVILKFNQRDVEDDQTPEVSAKIDGTALELKTTQLSKRVFRIKVFTSSKFLKNCDSDRIDWEFRYGSTLGSGQSFFLYNKGE